MKRNKRIIAIMNQTEEIAAIYKSFDSGLRVFILSRVKDNYITDDIMQDIYLKLHANIASLNDRTKLSSWIYQIARNSIVDHYRERQKSTSLPVYELQSPGGKQNKFMTEAIGDMIRMMDNLPPDYCEALCLTELEGMSQKEYAVKAGISYSGAKSRVQRGRLMLRDMLMKCCHYSFDRYGTILDIHQEGCCCCKEY